MKEVINIICGACKGKCCQNFPVFCKDIQTGRMFQNPTFFEETTGKATLKYNYRSDISLNCYYYTQGGCPDEIRPELCKLWHCSIFDEFILGRLRPFVIGSEPLPETMNILKHILRQSYK